MRSRRPIRAIAASLALLGALAAGSCVSDPPADGAPDSAAEAPARETRTGVPVLMDLPGIGVLFGRRTTRR